MESTGWWPGETSRWPPGGYGHPRPLALQPAPRWSCCSSSAPSAVATKPTTRRHRPPRRQAQRPASRRHDLAARDRLVLSRRHPALRMRRACTSGFRAPHTPGSADRSCGTQSHLVPAPAASRQLTSRTSPLARAPALARPTIGASGAPREPRSRSRQGRTHSTIRASPPQPNRPDMPPRQMPQSRRTPTPMSEDLARARRRLAVDAARLKPLGRAARSGGDVADRVTGACLTAIGKETWNGVSADGKRRRLSESGTSSSHGLRHVIHPPFGAVWAVR